MDNVQFKIRKLYIQKNKKSTNSASPTIPIQYLDEEMENYVRDPTDSMNRTAIWVKMNSNNLLLLKLIPKPKIHVKQFTAKYISEIMQEGSDYFDTEVRILEHTEPSRSNPEEIENLRKELLVLNEKISLYKTELQRIISENKYNLQDFSQTMQLFKSQIDQALNSSNPKSTLLHLFSGFDEAIPDLFDISLEVDLEDE